MEWIGLNELREMFLQFFESKGHLRHESFSLVPQGDASLLLINSGMAPLKKYFTGELTPPRVRMATCQKCIRTPDIESVGITARHGTYFEMLGNFSFGDYFKREAIVWAWEFFTDVLKMDPDKLYVTVFLEDDEAWDIWEKEVGVPASNISRLGRKDNFWEHGKGPCGPCSEIHYDRGEQYGCGADGCAPGCECDRYMEIWNLVFTQFDSDGEGNYSPLEKCNIDTGMGLERLACVSQQVNNLFEVDTVQNIMKHIMKIAGVAYGENAKTDISLRVITDHIRSTSMMISDGVLPSNEGRGYVLRRLLRRAARHGRLLKIERPFLAEVAETVIQENLSAYPQLQEKRDFILRVIATEEEHFSRTIDTGMQLLNRMADTMDAAHINVLSGSDAFSLSDTYGFPIDLIKEILAETHRTVDEDAFKDLARQQRERSRAARKEAGGWDAKGTLDTKELPATEFLGYAQDETEATVLAIFADGESAEYASENATIVLNRTPFYAESGGQAGDTGTLGGEFTVHATTKSPDGVILHHGEGSLRVGQTLRAAIDTPERQATRRNHTAAHLLQAALRQVLGTHVEQAGQSVGPHGMRFDFTHFSALSQGELRQVETLVNEAIWAGLPVQTEELPIEEAKARGALALFGEKYGSTVRMVQIPGFSTELCGGTHAETTGTLGMFFITGENSVASGVRRIEAVTAADAYALYRETKTKLELAAGALKAGSIADLVPRAEAVMHQYKEAFRFLAAAQEKLLGYSVQAMLQSAKEYSGVRLISGVLDDADGLRQACDIAKQSGENIIALFGAKTAKGMLQFAAACAPQAVKAGAHAGNLVKAAAQAAGGSGGGRPDSAMAGGKDPAKLQEALAAGEAALAAMIG